MIFIPKSARADTTWEHRGVTLLEVLLKWYVNTLVCMLERVTPPQYAKSASTFGFRAEGNCNQIMGPLRNLLAKCHEWQEHLPVCLFIGDILAAFDFLTPAEVDRVFEERAIPGQLSAAILREGRALMMEPRFHTVFNPQQIPMTRCENQGSAHVIEK